MRIDTLSTFPKMFDSVMGESMMKRAQSAGILDFKAWDLRDWTHDRHRTTDDEPYGGGHGLVMKCEPIYEALEDILELESGSLPESRRVKASSNSCKIISMSPHGRVLDDALSLELSKEDRLVFICGHYEGLDERVHDICDEAISIGDYVLTSGELASMVVIDSVVRKLPGVLGAEKGAAEESFSDGLLEHAQYTRPADFRGMKVPEVLLGGHHAKIARWRREDSLGRTLRYRPDLIISSLDSGLLDECDLDMLLSLIDAD